MAVICDSGIDSASVSTIYQLDFGTNLTVMQFFLLPLLTFILQNIRFILMKKGSIFLQIYSYEERVYFLEYHFVLLIFFRYFLQIEIDKSSWNVDKFAFNKVYVTANIKGEPVRFSSKSSLNIMDLPSTGQSIANQIWRYWNNPAVQKPK